MSGFRFERLRDCAAKVTDGHIQPSTIEAHIAFICKIQIGLNRCAQISQLVLPLGKMLIGVLQTAIDRKLALRLGFRIDQIGQGLCLSEVEAPVLESTQRELASFGRAHRFVLRKLIENRSHDSAAAVTMNFGNILTRKACWAGHEQDQRMIEQRTVAAPNRS